MRPAVARAARVLAGLTQAELARRAGVHLGTLVSYENSGRDTRPEIVARIRAALEVAQIVFRPDGSITTAEQVMDAFPAIAATATPAQRAEYALACSHVAQAGGRRPQMSEGARNIVKAYEKSLGIREDD